MSIYTFNYGFFDVIKIIFYKKRCPICNGKLKRRSEKEEYTETDENMIADFGRNAYNVTIYYICEECDKRVEISEL
ncbi:hypothetical protein [Clostridium saccharoperbutylacetonicum]